MIVKPLNVGPLTFWSATGGAVDAAGTVTSGRIALHHFLNGQLRGNWDTDQTGTLLILQESSPGSGGLEFTVAVDASQPREQYPFQVALYLPFVTFTWTQGATPSTFYRVFACAVPSS